MELNKRIVIEKVASGLRMMTNNPTAMIFRDDIISDWTWDEDGILGLPVYKAEGLMSCYDTYATTPILFIPIGVTLVDFRNFVDGWEG